MTQQNAEPLSEPNRNIYVMDITNYTWISTFDPPETKAPNKTTIILVSSFGVLIILVCGFFTYIWTKKRKRGQNNVALGFLGTYIMIYSIYISLNFD